MAAKIKTWPAQQEPKLLGFAAYKAGMTHAMITDKRPFSLTKSSSIAVPCTILECPPLKAVAVRFYRNTDKGFLPMSEVPAGNPDKELARMIRLPKKAGKEFDKVEGFDDVRIVMQAQPKLTGIGKKKPELFEIALGGKKDQKAAYAKELLGKEINISGVFKAGMIVDIHGITKGKGLQGPVKRHGISLKHHKSEKSRRNPGSLGSWKGQVNQTWRVAHAGQTGFHQRTEYNKYIMKISDKPDLEKKGGFHRYGKINNPYILIKGSVMGPKKRLIKLTFPIRPNKSFAYEPSEISYLHV